MGTWVLNHDNGRGIRHFVGEGGQAMGGRGRSGGGEAVSITLVDLHFVITSAKYLDVWIFKRGNQ